MSSSEQTSVPPAVEPTTEFVPDTSARIDWRKLLVPILFIMFLPTIGAFLVDQWLGTLPYITIVAIIVCFPTATVWVTRIALQEMDRVIAAVTPPAQEETAPATLTETGGDVETERDHPRDPHPAQSSQQ